MTVDVNQLLVRGMMILFVLSLAFGWWPIAVMLVSGALLIGWVWDHIQFINQTSSGDPGAD